MASSVVPGRIDSSGSLLTERAMAKGVTSGYHCLPWRGAPLAEIVALA
jgi:hypothetical protein